MLGAVNGGVYRLERWLCLGLLSTMSIAVFLDVVHRVWSTEGKIDKLFASALPSAIAPWVALAFYASVSTALIFAAMRTRKSTAHFSTPRTLAWAVGLTVAAGVGIKLLLLLAPNGLVWAQKYALCAMLWVGFIGASMACKENSHLTLEIVEFIWRGKAKKNIGRVGALSAAAFCAVLGYLCFLYVKFQYQTYVDSEGTSGLFEGFEAPLFIVFGVLPVTMWIMTLRYLGHAVSPPPEPTHDELTKKLDNQPQAKGAQ